MDKLERILALDIGTKRIGTAISDPFGIFATELELVLRKNDTQAITDIKKLAEKYMVKKIVVGVPYDTEGNIGPQAQNCIDFAKKLEDNFEIIYIDESMTSYEAEQILRTQKKKYTKNKGLVDLKAAALILTDYLNNGR
ncbi:Holliday junction resolvase RuvX [bacterium]|nr:Holliday junction resolvase RuvX [bacterium]